MLKRFVLWLISIALAAAAMAQVPPPPLRCDCCAKKPVINDMPPASFTGQIAVATQTEDPNDPNFLTDRVVVIWDLTNQAGAPLNVQWNGSSAPPTQPYSHASWTVKTLGEVFGISLNDSGDIFVAASRAYGKNNVGSLGTGTTAQRAGNIYILPNGTGAAAFYAQLPQGAAGEGLGNLAFDCTRKDLYASDFADGLIYRIVGPAPGVVQPNPWDHGVNLPSAGRPAILGNDGTSSYAALGRRPWAVRVYKDRLYYSIWGTDFSRTGGSNEVWSVALDVNGDPIPPARLEITVPPYPAWSVSGPVSDISFGPMGTMFLAERTMNGNNVPSAHRARILEYSWTGTQWVLPNPTAYQIGVFAGTNSAGGVDPDFGPGGRVWATGDAIHLAANDNIYGLQGTPSGGGTHVNSILIDLNDFILQQNKTQIGDVRIPCPDCLNPVVTPVISGPQTTCVLPANYTVPAQSGVTYSWSVTGGTPTTGTGPSINVTWGNAGGSISVTATSANGCSVVTTTLNVAPCNTGCDYCTQFKTDVTLPTPAPLGGGLMNVTPTVSSGMPGVTTVTVTLLSANVTYPSFCGASGPLPAYMASASAASVPSLNPPVLPVPNGNQAIWHSSTGVNLSSGVTTPFQIKLPPPPFSSRCRATYSFCLRVYLSDAQCRTCDVIRCFGAFAYSAGPPPPGGDVTGVSTELPVIIDGTTVAAPANTFLASLLAFLQDRNSLTLPQPFVMTDVSFEPGKAVMSESSMPMMQSLASILKAVPSLEVRLQGFTDNTGDAAANERLSLERAQALKNLLVRAGVDASRVVAEGLGAANPIAPNDNEAGRARNRRIEIVIMRK